MSYINYKDGSLSWINEESTLECECGVPDIAFSDEDDNHCTECERELPLNPPPAHKLELKIDNSVSQQDIQDWLETALWAFRYTGVTK